MTLRLEYDVVVVGAGPAGCIAAREVAKTGAKVLVIERKQEIGTPVRCGEGLGEHYIKELKLPNPSKWTRRKVKGAYLYSPDFTCVKVLGEKTRGRIIERKIFEKELAASAAREGAEFMVKTLALSVIKREGRVVGVKARRMGEELEVYAKVVIAADGFESTIAKSAGLSVAISPQDLDSGFEYEMVNVELEETDVIHIFLGNRLAPRGYIWIFPKDEDIANVGIGIGSFVKKSARFYLEKFLRSYEPLKRAQPIEVKGGPIPVGEPLKNLVLDGLMVVGDAARQVDPIHGGGMGLSMEAGMLAGRVAGEAVLEGDTSRGALQRYEKEWWERKGKHFRVRLALRKFLEKLSDEDLNILARAFEGEDVLDLMYGRNKLKLVAKVMKIAPSLAKLMLKGLIW